MLNVTNNSVLLNSVNIPGRRVTQLRDHKSFDIVKFSNFCRTQIA